MLHLGTALMCVQLDAPTALSLRKCGQCQRTSAIGGLLLFLVTELPWSLAKQFVLFQKDV